MKITRIACFLSSFLLSVSFFRSVCNSLIRKEAKLELIILTQKNIYIFDRPNDLAVSTVVLAQRFSFQDEKFIVFLIQSLYLSQAAYV